MTRTPHRPSRRSLPRGTAAIRARHALAIARTIFRGPTLMRGALPRRFETPVQPVALAVLAAAADYDERAIAVMEEAQVLGHPIVVQRLAADCYALSIAPPPTDCREAPHPSSDLRITVAT